MAELFPLMGAAQIEALAVEIKAAGKLSHPILVTESKQIIDGRAAYLACQKANVSPSFEVYRGPIPIPELVLRRNVGRRHLGQSQRAAAVVEAAAQMGELLSTAEAAAAREATTRECDKDLKSTGAILRPCYSSNNKDLQQNEKNGRASHRLALLCNVSPRYFEMARKIRSESPAIFSKVMLGDMNLSQASLAVVKRERLKNLRGSSNQTAARKASMEFNVVVGDCLAVMETMKGGTYNLIFADPPYNNGFNYDADPTGDKLGQDQYLAWCREWMGECRRLLAPNGSIFILIDDRYDEFFGSILRELGLHRRNKIIWWENFPNYTRHNFTNAARYIHYYTRGERGFIWDPDAIMVPSVRNQIGDARQNPNGKVPDNVWPITRQVGNKTDTAPFAQKPPQVPQLLTDRCVLAASLRGDRVLDPFCGNGTTGRSCLAHGRAFTGIERSALYAEQSKVWIAGADPGGGSGRRGDAGTAK
jgi:site-specific DNA-methyltransferase (adenine-specific)